MERVNLGRKGCFSSNFGGWEREDHGSRRESVGFWAQCVCV